MAMNDAVDWSIDLGGGVAGRPDPGGHVPVRRGDAVRARAVGPVGRPRRRRDRRQAAPAPGPQLPADRDASRVACSSRRASATGSTTRPARCAATRASGSCPRWRRPGSRPESINAVAMSHLHFDHAGGLLRADGSKAFPHAKIVAQQAEWEVALGDNPRLVASYVQPELRLVETWGKQGWVDGRARDPARGLGGPDRWPLDRPPGGHRPREWGMAHARWPSSATC